MNSTALLFTFRPPPPPTSVFHFLALSVLHLLSPGKWTLRIHSAPQIKSYYIVIFHHHFVAPSLYILLTPSVSPFPSTPSCFFFCLGHPVPLRIGYMVCDESWRSVGGGGGGGGFPITNLQFQELLQLSSPEKKLELCILDIYHLCILSCLTKRILQPQVIFSDATVWHNANAMQMFPKFTPWLATGGIHTTERCWWGFVLVTRCALCSGGNLWFIYSCGIFHPPLSCPHLSHLNVIMIQK